MDKGLRINGVMGAQAQSESVSPVIRMRRVCAEIEDFAIMKSAVFRMYCSIYCRLMHRIVAL